MDYLVIIDMQPRWPLVDKSIIGRIAAFAYQWSKTKPVLLVEFDEEPTYRAISRLVPNANIITKDDVDGSSAIDTWFVDNPDNNLKKLFLCGCYTGQCVAETLYGLLNLEYETKLIFELCQQSRELETDIDRDIDQFTNRSKKAQLRFFQEERVDIVEPLDLLHNWTFDYV